MFKTLKKKFVRSFLPYTVLIALFIIIEKNSSLVPESDGVLNELAIEGNSILKEPSIELEFGIVSESMSLIFIKL